MKSNKFLLCCCVFLFIAGCATNSEKPVIEKTAAEKTAPSEIASSNTTAMKSQIPAANGNTPLQSSVLPAGPVMPNPYLQVRPKLSEQVEVNFHDAVTAMQQKNWNHAETVLQQLAATNPNLSGVQLNLGIVYRAKGDVAKATEAFNRAITANPKNVEAYNQLAVIKREAGDFSGAETLYQKALGVWPFYPEGHKNIAILYELYLGKPEVALAHYQAYQQLLPAPDKQVDSWIADLQRRLNAGKDAGKDGAKNSEKSEAK